VSIADALPAAVAAIVDTLRAAGVQAAAGEPDLQPPGILVAPPLVHFKFGKCQSADFMIVAIAGRSGRVDALPVLAALIDAAGNALGWPFVEGRPTDWQSTAGALLPAYQLIWQARL
jgi:hypothetical protein